MASIPQQIIYAGQRLFERNLLDMAGGNISVRHGDTIYITARYSGSQRHWQNKVEHILTGKIQGNELLNNPNCSREGKAHLAIYRAFPEVGAIIHAHSFHILPFCAAARPIEPVLEQTQKFGTIRVVEDAPAHSLDLANNIVAGLTGQEERIKKQAAAVLMPHHGIMVAGKDLLATVDALERIDWNAYCLLAQKSLA
ncbi:MAG: class II aldolase/adducin family protein [Anaerolineae bacterium]|nr:class II aldolase/adducin family protein [Anaerolineae bacterium]